ncbi:MAG TPA: hypothetical protein VGK73_36840 [Polyangiaceae bacterium]
MELLPRVALALRGKRVLIWAMSAIGLVCGVWGQVAGLRGDASRAVAILYAGFLVAAIGGALHSIAFWFAPRTKDLRSRFDRLAWFVRPYPFLEVFLALMWLTAVVVNGFSMLAR